MTETEHVSASAAAPDTAPDTAPGTDRDTSGDIAARARAVAATAFMVPMLPCADVDEMADFWTSLGLTVTYRQRRPNPYVALELGGIVLHYYEMPEWDPEKSHSTCAVAVPDTEPVHDLFAAGLRERFGRLPVTGFPRITRPRRRANNAGLSGFSLIDPAGNWVRVTHVAPSGTAADADGDPGAAAGPAPAGTDVAPWSATPGGGPVARALDTAVVLADSQGDPAQARKILAGALRRATGTAAGTAAPTASGVPVAELAPALAYLVELCVRTGDPEAARSAHERLADLAAADLAPADRNVADVALTESREVLPVP
ncbi:hypothetical protein ACIGB8_02105 [Promicromonospora sukumoe]|uniref:hypothetical protein n=1 Tax=Promicromonospora sukumoe TaxID=88382 RepID=UPI0037C5CE1E